MPIQRTPPKTHQHFSPSRILPSHSNSQIKNLNFLLTPLNGKRSGSSTKTERGGKHTPRTSPSTNPLPPPFGPRPPSTPSPPQASTTIANRAPVPVSQPQMLNRSSTICSSPRSWSTRLRSRDRRSKMSRDALRRKENSRWARGVLVCGGKTEMWRGLSWLGVSHD